MGEGEGAGLMELEDWPSEWREPVDWYMPPDRRLQNTQKELIITIDLQEESGVSSPLTEIVDAFSHILKHGHLNSCGNWAITEA